MRLVHKTASPSATRTSSRPRVALAVVVGVVTALLLTFVLSVDLLPRVYDVKEGDVAPVAIKAPRKISFVSQIRTRQARDAAAAQVPPVIELSRDVISQQTRGLADLIQAINVVRGDRTRPALDDRTRAIAGLITPSLSDTTARQLAILDDYRWSTIANESQRALQDIMKDRIPDDRVDELRNEVPLHVSPMFAEADRSVVVELVQRFVRSNQVLNKDATSRAQQDAREAVAPVEQTYERGQTVVRDGQVVGPQEIEALEALGLRNPELDWQAVAAAGLLSFTIIGVLAAFIWHFDRALLYRDRRMILLAGLVLVAAVAARMVIPGRPLWAYVFPLPAISMLLAILIDAQLAVAVGVMLSILLAWIAGASLEVGVIGLVGTMVGSLAVWRKERMIAYFVAGAEVASAMVAAYVAFFLASRSDDLALLSIVSFELLVNGLLSSLLAVGSFALLGRLFGILTTMQLLELANPTQPLLRRLLMEAPGTYHHSIMVGNLAERAAEVIGADSLLVRVAAYYHDVGKLERPWAFIENQADTVANVHDTLDPVASAQVIAAHVTDGVKLAERYRLPARIREMIPQHHGTRTISFFYQQAAERTTETVDAALFTYPGPRPQSREAAILMLSDSTEAAARASRDHSREAIEQLVERIIRQRLEEGQFDDCNLTLRDLTRIKQSFVTLLTGIYHPRIPYPPSGGEARPALGEARSSAGSDVAASA
ncbi:MAG: HDIG domain-containing protein [Chloroflexi bacterium]|nr:MAG: HDIG domain-containing protein [Chloroflexota bacterium]